MILLIIFFITNILKKMYTIILLSFTIVPYDKNIFWLPNQLVIYLPKYTINKQW